MARKTRTSTSRRKKATISRRDMQVLREARTIELEQEVAFLREELTKLAQSNYDQISRLQDATGGVWKMADGTMIAVRDMSDSHLANALKLVQQKPPTAGSQGWISLFEKEIERRRVDREWAKKTGHVSEIEARLAQVQERIERLEQENKSAAWRANTALDVRLQVTTALNTIRRLVGIENLDVVRSLERLLDRVLP